MRKEDLIGMQVVCTYSKCPLEYAVDKVYSITKGLKLSIRSENGGLERWSYELPDEFSIDRLNEILNNTYAQVKFKLLKEPLSYLDQLESLLNQTEYDHDDVMELIEHLKKLV